MTELNAITPITIEDEMQRSYLDYAMSVIVSRALPDARDGLKPVHRRILYAMHMGGYSSSKPFKKSARIVGDVMGQFHPHGDAAIYDALVRMAQDFSMRLPLIDGQGNFGSMDGDPPAAMRYTEARLHKAAEELLADIDRDTVNFQPNYDESTEEPTVLPAKFPNLLVNGANGIAVGMATNIPTHNLGEVCTAAIAYIDNPDVSIDTLMEVMPGPDFPTGGIILGRAGIRSAFHTGRGSVVMRGRTEVEEIRKDRQAIIITDIPYQVNKLRLIERISECVNEKIIEGISELRDESDREGVRIVVELKRDAMADIVLNQLYKHTPLQTSFGVNALALQGGRPQQMTLIDFLKAFLDFRQEVIIRRTEFDLKAARARAHILIGLAVAVANIDAVIALIRKAPNPETARAELMARAWPADSIVPLLELVSEAAAAGNTYRLSEAQAKAILDLRLHRLTGLERDKIGAELNETVALIKDLLDILARRDRVMEIIKEELAEIREKFATPRRTAIEDQEGEIDIEELIQREEMVVTVSHGGYVKRVPLSTYRAQKRGGKGRAGMTTKEEDFVSELFVASTHTPMLFFSSLGKVYQLKVYKLPLGNPQARGKALVNLLPLEQGENITAVLAVPEDAALWPQLDIVFATEAGTVRRNKLTDFDSIRASGLIAMKLEEGDKLIGVRTCTEGDDILLATAQGKAIRFPLDDVRVFAGRTSVGVRGIKLAEGDKVISLTILKGVDATAEERAAYLKTKRHDDEAGDSDDEQVAAITLDDKRMAQLAAQEEFILTATQRGFGKISSAYEYRRTARGGSGIFNIKMAERNGAVVATFRITPTQEIMLVTDGGQIIRMNARDIRVAGRTTMGVTLFRLDEAEKVVSVAVLDEDHLTEGDNHE